MLQYVSKGILFPRLLGHLTGLGLLELQHSIYPRLLTRFGILVFFPHLSLMELHVRYLALFLLFSVIDGAGQFWMGNLHQNIQLILEFLKTPFLVPHYNIAIYADNTTLNCVIWHLICGSNQNWLRNLNQIYKTLWTGAGRGGTWLVYFNVRKLSSQLVSFDRSNNTGAIDLKMDGSVLEEKSFFKVLGLTFSSKVDQSSCIIGIAEYASKKIGALIRFMKFFSPEVAMYLYKSTIWSWLEFCGHVQAISQLLFRIVR